jgi:hypothetical protein
MFIQEKLMGGTAQRQRRRLESVLQDKIIQSLEVSCEDSRGPFYKIAFAAIPEFAMSTG